MRHGVIDYTTSSNWTLRPNASREPKHVNRTSLSRSGAVLSYLVLPVDALRLMQTCLASTQGRPMATKAITSARCLIISAHQPAVSRNQQRGLRTYCISGPLQSPRASVRGISTSTPVASDENKPTSKAKVLTLLHNTSRFLPRALGRGKSQDSEADLEYWSKALNDVWDDLSTGSKNRKLQVAGELCLALNVV